MLFVLLRVLPPIICKPPYNPPHTSGEPHPHPTHSQDSLTVQYTYWQVSLPRLYVTSIIPCVFSLDWRNNYPRNLPP